MEKLQLVEALQHRIAEEGKEGGSEKVVGPTSPEDAVVGTALVWAEESRPTAAAPRPEAEPNRRRAPVLQLLVASS